MYIAPIHYGGVAVQALAQTDFVNLPHPPYSLYLALSDFYLFRHLKQYLSWQKFDCASQLKWCVENWFAEKNQAFF